MLSPEQLRELEGLTRAQRRAWGLVARYARSTGRRCFTYQAIMRWWRENPDIPIRPQTLDRRLRELAGLGLLERGAVSRGPRSTRVFCVRRDLFESLVGGVVG